MLSDSPQIKKKQRNKIDTDSQLSTTSDTVSMQTRVYNNVLKNMKRTLRYDLWLFSLLIWQRSSVVGNLLKYQVHKFRNAASLPTTDDLPRVFYLLVNTQSVLPLYVSLEKLWAQMVIRKHAHHQTALEIESSERAVTFPTVQSLSATCPLSPVRANVSAPAERRETLRGPYQQLRRHSPALLVFTRWVPATRQHRHKEGKNVNTGART